MKLHFEKSDIEDVREVNSPDFWNGQICEDWLAMHAEVERLQAALHEAAGGES